MCPKLESACGASGRNECPSPQRKGVWQNRAAASRNRFLSTLRASGRRDHSCNGRAAMDGRGRTREVRRFLYVRLGPKAPLQAIGAPVGHSKASKIKTTQKLPRSSVYVEVCGIHVTESLQNASSECGRGSHFHPRLFFNSRPAKLLRVLGCFAAQYAGRLRRERTSSARGVGR